MAARKQFLGSTKADSELVKLMEKRRQKATTEADLREQRISYAFGNAMHIESVTKESVRESSRHVKLRA
jgi:hypothetical protein